MEYSLKLSHEDIPWRTESKAKKFKDLVRRIPSATFTHRRILESTLSFVLEGPVLRTFKQWLDVLDPVFPNRHAVEHGRYDEKLYCEESSIKVFLLLDTIYHIITREGDTTNYGRHH